MSRCVMRASVPGYRLRGLRLRRAIGPVAWTAIALVAVAFEGASAVVITTGDGTGNTSAPPDDPGFDHVGDKGTTGVYIGNRWVLTANHAHATDIRFGGITYAWVEGTEVQLTTGGVPSDLLIYRVWPEPPLPGVAIADAPPQIGESVTMIGRGNNRAVAATYWDADWNEVTPPDPFVYAGWKQSGGRTIRWGVNVITGIDLDLTAVGATSREFRVDFDDALDEAQAVTGDSGGAVFVERGGQWQLLGIMNLVSTFTDQPTKTEVFGNRTYSIDLSYYKGQIDAVVARGVPAADGRVRTALAALLAAFGVVAACRTRASGAPNRVRR